MRRLVVFLGLAAVGLTALIIAAGGWGGTKTGPETPAATLSPAPPATGPTTTVRVDTLPLGTAKPKNAPRVEVQPLGAFATSITKPHEWVDPVTRERISIPYYVELSLRMDAPSAEPSPGAGVPWFKWNRVHVTGYRDPTTLTRKEVEAVLKDPANRRDLVLYEIDAEEGSANVRLSAIADGQKPLPPRFVLRLTKDVRLHVVPDDVHVETADLVLDQGAGTLEGGADLVATGPAFTATGTGLRLDRRSGRVELVRNVAFRAEQLTDERGRMPALDLGTGPFQPKSLRTTGSVVLVRHESAGGRVTYEAVLSDDVRVDALDGSRLTARRVVLDIVPREEAKPAAPKPTTPAERNVLAPPKGRWRLRSMVAEGDVRVRGEERGAAQGTAADDRVVTIETDRLSGRFDDPTRAVATLEGRTVLTYVGLLTLPGGTGARGTVVARCRQGVTYGPPVAAADARICDVVVDLVGAVELDGTVPPAEGSERLTAERVRLLLRHVPAPAKRPATAAVPAGPHAPSPDLVAVAFLATGDDVRISGPVVSGRAREMKAFELDQPDGWRLVLTGPDAYLEVDEVASNGGALGARAPGAADAAAPKDGKDAAARRPRETWLPDRLEATGGVRGALAPRPGDAPVGFTAQSLAYTEADGGELRGPAGGKARLTYPGTKGHDQSVEAPLVGFRVGDETTTLWTRGGTKAVVWTDPREDAPPPRRARRTVVLRGGSSLEIGAGRTAAAEATITVAARDGASLENRVDGVAGDRLEAASLTVTLAKRSPTTARPGGARTPATGPAARPAGRGPAPTSPLAGPVTRWTLACEEVDVELAGHGEGLASLRSFVASGNVDAASDAQADGTAQRFEGTRLSIRAEGDGHHGRLEGTRERRATLAATDETLPQWISAPTVDFVLDGVTLSSATFAPPVSARFHHRLDGSSMFEGLAGVAGAAPPAPAGPPKTPADAPLERIALRTDAGPLTIARRSTGRDGLTVVTLSGTEADPVVLARSTRDPGAREFGPPVRLASPRVELTMKGMLGVADASPEKFVATGPGTRVEIPSEEGPISATGQNLTFDRATWELRLDGPDGVFVTRPRLRLRGRWFSYNVKTGARDVGAPSAEAAR